VCDSIVAAITSHRDLVVWQKSMDLVERVYRLTATLPCEETYRLISQTTRAATSVPANIAEGFARASPREYARFLAVAKGSLMETETLLVIAARLGYLKAGVSEPTLALIAEISKMLTVLRTRILQSRRTAQS